MEINACAPQSPSKKGKAIIAKICQKTIFQQIGEKDTDLRSITKTKKGMKLSAYIKSTSYKLVISQSKEHLSKLVVSNEVKNVAVKKSQEKAKPKRQNTTENANVLPQKNNPMQLNVDELRSAGRKQLRNTLLGDGKLPEKTLLSLRNLAILIEETIFKNFKSIDLKKYRTQMRSRIFNLKLNPDLRLELLGNFISPQEFAMMSFEEMATNEMKNERKSIAQTSIQKSILPFVEGTQSHNYRCENCSNRNCSYQEFQNRSAYRSTTIVVLCNNCGKTWNE